MIDERKLIDGCRENDRISQRKLYEQFAGRMLAVAQRYTQSRFHAEDILQDAFVKVFLQFNTFREDCPLEAWIRRIVVNTAISFLRKEKTWFNNINIDDCPPSILYAHNGTSEMEYEQLLDLIRQLPKGCQIIFNLYAIEGFNHQEIAEMLNISEGTSKSQYHRAKDLLKTKIEADLNRKTA